MASWTSSGDAADWISDNLDSSIFTTISDGLEAVGAGAGVVADAMQLVDLILSAGDPLSALMLGASAVLEDLIEDIEGSDIYVFPMMPTSWADLLRPYTAEQALSDLAISLGDTRDSSRPVLSQGAAYASVTLMIGADNWMDFTTLIRLLGELFDGSEWNKWKKLANMRFKFDQLSRTTVRRPLRNTQGIPWDWHRTDLLEEVPVIGQLLNKFRELIDAFNAANRGIANGIAEMAEMIEERAQYIAALANEIQEVVDLIRAWRELLPSARFLAVASDGISDAAPASKYPLIGESYGELDGGTQGYITALMDAGGDKPRYKLCAGITLVAFGPNPIASFNRFMNLLGIQLRFTETAARQAFGDDNE